VVLAIDATGDEAARARAVAAIRTALATAGRVRPLAAPASGPDLARLRAEARQADIDIGE